MPDDHRASVHVLNTTEIRCSGCAKKLASVTVSPRGLTRLEMVCPRCRRLNTATFGPLEGDLA
jgi:phage FluMu protein Com